MIIKGNQLKKSISDNAFRVELSSAVLRKRNDGVMEYWNIGIMEGWNNGEGTFEVLE